MLILFRLAAGTGSAGQAGGLSGEVLVAIAGGIFILPFFLFSATAGQLADQYDKARMIRLVKAAEIAIMGLGAAGLAWGRADFRLAVDRQSVVSGKRVSVLVELGGRRTIKK